MSSSSRVNISRKKQDPHRYCNRPDEPLLNNVRIGAPLALPSSSDEDDELFSLVSILLLNRQLLNLFYKFYDDTHNTQIRGHNNKTTMEDHEAVPKTKFNTTLKQHTYKRPERPDTSQHGCG